MTHQIVSTLVDGGYVVDQFPPCIEITDLLLEQKGISMEGNLIVFEAKNGNAVYRKFLHDLQRLTWYAYRVAAEMRP